MQPGVAIHVEPLPMQALFFGAKGKFELMGGQVECMGIHTRLLDDEGCIVKDSLASTLSLSKRSLNN
jgi:hypothetical protein